MLGWDLLPIQQHKLDVALEHDGNGNLYYDLIVDKAPRRSGKTTQNLAVILHRVQEWQDQKIIYTAQTLNDARKKWRKEHCKRIKSVKGFRDKRDYVIRNMNGDESIDFPRTGGSYAISATGEKSGHGDELHLYVCDEAFSHEDLRVDQSFLPTMDTVHNPQQWVTSAAGTYKGIYFIDKVDVGKAAVEADTGRGTCAFIWEADKDADRASHDVWRQVHPTLGTLLSLDRMQKRFDRMDSDEFARAYLGITTAAPGVAASPLSDDAWSKAADEDSHIAGRAMIGLAMTPDRMSVSLGVAGLRPEGDWHVDHVRTAGGSAWVVPAVLEMRQNFPEVRGVALDGGGPASSLIAELEAAGVEVTRLSGQGYGRACGAFADSVNDNRLWHRGQAELATAVGVSASRALGDLWVWVRRNGDESVAALEAVTVALGGAAMLAEDEAPVESPLLARGGLFKL